jgi:hypothetical protein
MVVGSVTVLEEGRGVYNDLNLNGRKISPVIEPAFSHRADSVGLVRIQVIYKVTYDFFDQSSEARTIKSICRTVNFIHWPIWQ